MNTRPTPQIGPSRHAILISAHHDPAFKGDRNWGLVIGIQYLAAVLERAEWTVEMLCGPRGEEDLADRLRVSEPAFVGISATSDAYRHAVTLGRCVRRISPQTPIILGGVHATVYGAEVLRRTDAFDAVAVGEGEPIVADIAAGVALDQIDGLILRVDGAIVERPPRPPIQDVDALPFPAPGRFRPELRVEDSFGVFPCVDFGSPLVAAPLVTTRGCNFRCTFCRSSMGPRLRARSVESVIAEIDWLARRGIRFVHILDSNFLHRHDRARAIVEAMGARGMRWSAMARPEGLTDELCRCFARNGCALLAMSLESFDPAMRRLYGKGGNLTQARAGVATALRAGLMTKVYMILGPQLDGAALDHEVDELIALGPDFIQYKVLLYEPGTKLWEDACDDGRIPEHWSEVPLTMTDVDRWIPKDMLRRAMRRYHRRFYWRPLYLARQWRELCLKGRWPGWRMRAADSLSMAVVMAKALAWTAAGGHKRMPREEPLLAAVAERPSEGKGDQAA